MQFSAKASRTKVVYVEFQTKIMASIILSLLMSGFKSSCIVLVIDPSSKRVLYAKTEYSPLYEVPIPVFLVDALFYCSQPIGRFNL